MGKEHGISDLSKDRTLKNKANDRFNFSSLLEKLEMLGALITSLSEVQV